MTANVLNRNEIPVVGTGDNKLILGGTVMTESGISLTTKHMSFLVDVTVAGIDQHHFFSIPGRISIVHAVLNLAQGGAEDFTITLKKNGSPDEPIGNGALTFGNNAPESSSLTNVITDDEFSNFDTGDILVFSKSGTFAVGSSMQLTIEYILG